MYYRPNVFSPSLSRCSQFGTKDVLTGEITYEYADLSRMANDKCGLEALYYNESNLIIQALQFAFINNLPMKAIVALFFLSIWANNDLTH
jgi:hypothetical protein